MTNDTRYTPINVDNMELDEVDRIDTETYEQIYGYPTRKEEADTIMSVAKLLWAFLFVFAVVYGIGYLLTQ